MTSQIYSETVDMSGVNDPIALLDGIAAALGAIATAANKAQQEVAWDRVSFSTEIDLDSDTYYDGHRMRHEQVEYKYITIKALGVNNGN